MKMDDDNLLHLLPDHTYYAQVQGEMAVLDVEWCGLIVFSNDTVIADWIITDYDYWINLLESWNNFTYSMWYWNFYLVKYLRKTLEQLSRNLRIDIYWRTDLMCIVVTQLKDQQNLLNAYKHN